LNPRIIPQFFYTRKTVHFFILVTVGLLIYANAMHAAFQFDDYGGIVNDPYIRNPLNFRAIADAFNTRFILGFSFSLNYAIGECNVFGYHLFNIVVHILSSFFVYAFVILTFQTPAMKDKTSSENRSLIAFFTALIFLAHPIQTQAVTYIWQRSTSLASFFYLATLVLYIQSRLKRSLFFYMASMGACILGMFTKEITITLPFAVALYEFFFFRRTIEGKKKTLILLLPFILTLPIILLTLMRAPEVTLEVMRLKPAESVPMTPDITRFVDEKVMKRHDYMLTELNVIRTYLRLLFFPVRQNLDYDYPIAKSFFEPDILLSFLLLAILFLSAVLMVRNFPMISFGVFWFFLTLSVESLVVQSDVIFEHRLYLPMVGFSIAFVTALSMLLKWRKFFVGVLVTVVIILSIMTYFRNRVWKDDYTLWRDVTAKSPNKYRGYSNLALAFERDKNYDMAIEYFKKSTDRAPYEAREFYNLGLAYFAKGDLKQAVQCFKKAILLKPLYDEAYNNIGVAYVVLGQKDEALSAFEKAIEINPRFAGAYKNLAKFYSDAGETEAAKNYFQKAESISSSKRPI